MTDITAKLAAMAQALVTACTTGIKIDGQHVGVRQPEKMHVENLRDALTAYTASQGTRDEETVERVARAIGDALEEGGYFRAAYNGHTHIMREAREKAARAALSAIPAPADDGPSFGPLDPRVHDLGKWEPARDDAALADLALDYLHLAQPEFCSARCPSVGREGEPIPHLPECVSMRSLLDGLPFATPGATISTGLMAKLKKLANYLTEQGEYEACDLIDTVVDRLSASPPTPARDDALEALRELSEASRDVLAERQRQISAEGWTPEHDDEHDGEEMADAAACYASNKALFWAAEYALDVQGGDRATKDFVSYQPLWPWEHHWWKPRDRRRDLVRAGALILAEIERLDRKLLAATERGEG